jgi:nucleoside phosphorylase
MICELSGAECLQYTIGWVAPMPKEKAAAVSVLKTAPTQIGSESEYQRVNVNNTLYTVGRIWDHYVVIICPTEIGTGSTCAAVDAMKASFKNIKQVLLVGIGGGIPAYGASRMNQIVLGDVVVSYPSWRSGGVCQYDFGAKKGEHEFSIGSHKNKPSEEWINAVNELREVHTTTETRIRGFIEEMRKQIDESQRQNFRDQGPDADYLFEEGYTHPINEKLCEGMCDRNKSSSRKDRGEDAFRHIDFPKVHYDTIGSGNSLIVSSQQRN